VHDQEFPEIKHVLALPMSFGLVIPGMSGFYFEGANNV
jgi:hypothetical protein